MTQDYGYDELNRIASVTEGGCRHLRLKPQGGPQKGAQRGGGEPMRLLCL